MFFKMGSFLLAAVLLPLVFLSGCTSSTEQEAKEGRLYAVNNARPGSYIKSVWIILEGMRYDIPFNMTEEKQPTGEGAIELTDAPLPGGMVVEVTYGYRYGDIGQEGKITVTVDGNMTIDVYMKSWESRISVVTAQVVPGRWDGVHSY